MTETVTIKRRFKDSIRRGTGEAHLIIRNHPNLDFSRALISACLTNFAYDGQCESSRGFYLYELILLAKNRDKIRNAILAGLAKEQSDTWALNQLFDLSMILAQNGDVEARTAIYDRFFTSPIEGSDWVGYAEILELDGMDGMKFIAEKIGRGLEVNPQDWQDVSIIQYFQDENPGINVLKELQELAVENRFVKLYIDSVNLNKAKPYKRKIFKYKDIIEEVLTSKNYIRLVNRILNTEELNTIAQRLLIEDHDNFQEKLLYVFTKFKFPLDSDFILRLANQELNPQNRIVEFAIEALKHLKSDNIRQFALQQIKEAERPELYTNILTANYEEMDSLLLTELVGKFNGEDEIEVLACSYINIYKANITKACREPLEALYAKMNCGIHRMDIIELLISNGVLTERLKEEIQYDCNLDSRGLLNNIAP